MVIANITTFKGQCFDAEHYYCKYCVIDNDIIPSINYNTYATNNKELKRRLYKESEIKELNIKDTWNGWHLGDETTRFNTIDDIHSKLIELYDNETIITYFKNNIFREMLYYKNKINLGYNKFNK